jgi:hypothetical protein
LELDRSHVLPLASVHRTVAVILVVLKIVIGGRPQHHVCALQAGSNITHRGKAVRVDWDLLKAATGEVLRIFEDVLRAAEEDAQWSGTSR